MNSSFRILALLLITNTALYAQTTFKLNGLGRAAISNDKMDGAILNGDTTSPSKASGGYTLFDLAANIEKDDRFYARAILRAKNEFGLFYGAGATFNFRQITLGGKINKQINYTLGDVDMELTPYTLFNPNDSYHSFESDIFALRRSVLQYENFINGNNWRLQGAKADGEFKLGEKFKLQLLGSLFRTNSTNSIDVSDRILSGNKIAFAGKNGFVAINHAGIFEIPIENYSVHFSNHVFTSSFRYTLIKNKFSPFVAGEAGVSNYSFEDALSDTTRKKQDFFYDLKIGAKISVLSFSAGFREVGPQFASPAAQSRRLNVNTTPLLFPSISNNTAIRSIANFDRFTEEKIYNRKISPVLYNYIPAFENANPYGIATPNRRGIYLNVLTDTTLKLMRAELIGQYQSEITPDRVNDGAKRNFLTLAGGVEFNLHQLFGSQRKLILKGGASYENTSRAGVGKINLSSVIIDGAAQWEMFKKIHLLLGFKSIQSNGNEYLSQRNKFNDLIDQNPAALQYNFNEFVLASGIQCVLDKQHSVFAIHYNWVQFSNKQNAASNMTIQQLYFNYTINF